MLARLFTLIPGGNITVVIVLVAALAAAFGWQHLRVRYYQDQTQNLKDALSRVTTERDMAADRAVQWQDAYKELRAMAARQSAAVKKLAESSQRAMDAVRAEKARVKAEKQQLAQVSQKLESLTLPADECHALITLCDTASAGGLR